MADQILAIAVVLLPTIFAVVLELVNDEIKKSIGWRIGVMVFGLSLSVLTAYQMVRATKAANTDREQAIRETSTDVSASVSESVSKSVTKSVSDQYTQTINTLQGKISTLQAQLSVQGRKVDVIGKSNIVTGKSPIRVEVTNPGELSAGETKLDIKVSSIQGVPNPKYGKNAIQLIMTTNKIMQGARVAIECKNKISQGSETLAGVSGTMGGGSLVDDHTYQTGIESPNWTPERPLVVTLYSDGYVLPCSVKPLP